MFPFIPGRMGVVMKKKLAALAALGAGSVGSAMAAVPASVTTALTDAQADAVSVAGTVIGIIVAIAAFMFMRKAIR